MIKTPISLGEGWITIKSIYFKNNVVKWLHYTNTKLHQHLSIIMHIANQ